MKPTDAAKVNNPAASNEASSLLRCRAGGYVTLAALSNARAGTALGSLLAEIKMEEEHIK